MNLNFEYYKNLFESFINDELSSFEINELFEFISNNPENLNFIINQEKDGIVFANLIHSAEISEGISKRMHDRLIEHIQTKQKKSIPGNSHLIKDTKLRIIKYWWAAASIFILGSVFFWTSNQYNRRTEIAKVGFKNEIKNISTGDNDVLLTLSDGSQILLDADKKGLIALQGNSQINLKNGYLTYNKIEQGKNLIYLSYNTISTPKGKNFKVILADNTAVWLNAESSISYPTDFMGNERKIKITGEVYFEVAPDKSRPFIVETGKETEIKVLGTHFNVNSYSNEKNVKTTLFEGSVEIKLGNKISLLTPGDQAEVNMEDGIKINKNVNLNHVVAWRNEAFSFVNQDIPSIMRELSRWYDIDVEYSGQVPNIKFNGEIGKSLTLSQVLKILKHAGVKYNIEKKKLIILSD